MLKKSLPKFIGLLLAALVLPVFFMVNILAAGPDAVITTDAEEAKVSVELTSSSSAAEEVSVICLNPGWDGDLTDLTGSQENIVFLDQYRMSGGKLSFDFRINEVPVQGEYTLVVGSAGGRTIETFRFEQPDEQVTVTYKAGTGGKIQGQAVQTISKGAATSAVTAVPDSGYMFVKWSDGKTAATRNETNVQQSVSVTAEFSQQKTYTVTLDPNGGTVSQKTILVKDGGTFGTLPAPSRKGYEFQGWYTAKTGGTQITASAKVTGNVTVYARWKDSPLAKGAAFKTKTLKYKVVKKASAKANGTVQITAPASKSLNKVSIPKTVKSGSFTYKVVSIKKNAFKNSKKLKTVVIGSNVRVINNNAFYGCIKLESVVIGKNVTKIGSKVFYNNRKLKKITIQSKKLNKIGKKTFTNIHNRAVIKVPESKLRTYRNKLKGKGQKSTVQIKK